jgi:hypothetical protein
MKTKATNRLLAFSSITAGAALLFTGCATSSGYKQADKTGAGIAEFRDEVIKGQKAVDDTVKALDQIAATATSDPRKSFEEFRKQVANLDSTAAKVRKRGQEMRVRGQAYFKEWEEQLAQVSNPEIRALAEQRKAKLQATFQSIKQYAEPLQAQFDPWMSDLRDLQTYLANDLTIAGVDAAKKLFTKTTSTGLEVQKSMEALVAELNTVAATITPAKVTAK